MVKKILFSLLVVFMGIIVFFISFLNASQKHFLELSRQKIAERDFNFFLRTYTSFYASPFVYEYHNEETNLSIVFVDTYTYSQEAGTDLNALSVYVANNEDIILYDTSKEESKSAIIFHFANGEKMTVDLNDNETNTYALAKMYSEMNYFLYDLFKDDAPDMTITAFELYDINGTLVFTTANDANFTNVDLSSNDFDSLVNAYRDSNPDASNDEVIEHITNLGFIKGFDSREQAEIFIPKMRSVYINFGIYVVVMGFLGYALFKKKK